MFALRALRTAVRTVLVDAPCHIAGYAKDKTYGKIRPYLPKKNDAHGKALKSLNAQILTLKQAKPADPVFQQKAVETRGAVQTRMEAIETRLIDLEGFHYGDVRGLLRQTKMKASEHNKLQNPAYKALREEQAKLLEEYGALAGASLTDPGVRAQLDARKLQLQQRKDTLGSFAEKKGEINALWSQCKNKPYNDPQRVAHRKLLKELDQTKKEIRFIDLKIAHVPTAQESLQARTQKVVNDKIAELTVQRDQEDAQTRVDFSGMAIKTIKGTLVVGVIAAVAFAAAGALQPKPTPMGSQLVPYQPFNYTGAPLPCLQPVTTDYDFADQFAPAGYNPDFGDEEAIDLDAQPDEAPPADEVAQDAPQEEAPTTAEETQAQQPVPPPADAPDTSDATSSAEETQHQQPVPLSSDAPDSNDATSSTHSSLESPDVCLPGEEVNNTATKVDTLRPQMCPLTDLAPPPPFGTVVDTVTADDAEVDAELEANQDQPLEEQQEAPEVDAELDDLDPVATAETTDDTNNGTASAGSSTTAAGSAQIEDEVQSRQPTPPPCDEPDARPLQGPGEKPLCDICENGEPAPTPTSPQGLGSRVTEDATNTSADQTTKVAQSTFIDIADIIGVKGQMPPAINLTQVVNDALDADFDDAEIEEEVQQPADEVQQDAQADDAVQQPVEEPTQPDTQVETTTDADDAQTPPSARTSSFNPATQSKVRGPFDPVENLETAPSATDATAESSTVARPASTTDSSTTPSPAPQADVPPRSGANTQTQAHPAAQEAARNLVRPNANEQPKPGMTAGEIAQSALDTAVTVVKVVGGTIFGLVWGVGGILYD